MLHNFRFADFEKPRFRFDFCACSRSSWIADGDRTGVVMRHCPEHIDKFIFVLRLHVHAIRDVPQVTAVEQAMVRRAVVAGYSSAAPRGTHVPSFRGHVLNRSVVAWLAR